MSDPTPQLPLTLKISLNGDWHVGEGAGQPGHIDRLVRRHPEDQLPYLPAKTLTGIWRDGCEAVAEGLDQQATRAATWSQWVKVLFGDQPALRDDRRDYDQPIKEARLSIRAAQLPEKLSQHLKTKRTLRQSVTFIKPGIKIDPDTGQALDEHLRFEELVRGGAKLAAPVSLDTSGCTAGQRQAAQALLWAGAKVVERLGGKRRRGLGRCRFELGITQEQVEELLQILQRPAPMTPTVSTGQQTGVTEISSNILPTTTDWVIVPMTVRLRTPVIVPDRTVGNVVQSLNFVPGTYLLGRVTQVLTRLLGHGLLAEVARGDLRLANAYIEVEGQRGLPVPLALFYEKDRGGLDKKDGHVWNRLADRVDEEQATQLKQYRVGYVGEFNSKRLPPFRKVPLQQTTHNTVQDEVQRPTEVVGGVYTHEAIKASTVLRAELRLRKALADALSAKNPNWWQQLNGEVRLGIAKKDDYGLAELKIAAPAPVIWQSQGVAASSTLTVWLLSDLLLRDERLRLSVSIDLLKGHLEKRLEVGLKVRQTATAVPPGDGEHNTAQRDLKPPLAVLVRPRRTDGWQVSWGLPRASCIGLMAGSCIVFEVDGNLVEDTLRQVEQEGLGERRAEGFGEVAFNHPLVTSRLIDLTLQEPQGDHSTAKSPDPIPRGDPSHEYARTIETAAWHEAIRRTAEALGADTGWRRDKLGWDSQKKVPPNSQLGSLRAAVASLRSTSDQSRVLGWLKNLEANRKEKWPGNSLQVLQDLMTQSGAVWRWLRERAGEEAFPTMTEDGERVLESGLWATAMRSLLFACIRGEVRDREL